MLNSANLQLEKPKSKESSSKRSVKGKSKPVKDKKTSRKSPKPSHYRHKGYVTNNDLLDNVDTKPTNSESSESNEEVEEIAAHSQDLGKVPLSLWVLDIGATTYITN